MTQVRYSLEAKTIRKVTYSLEAKTIRKVTPCSKARTGGKLLPAYSKVDRQALKHLRAINHETKDT